MFHADVYEIEITKIDEPKDEHQKWPGCGTPEHWSVEGDEDKVGNGDGKLEDDVRAGEAEVLTKRSRDAKKLQENEETEDDDEHDEGSFLDEITR